MGKRYQYPTSYRDKECPYCGLYFSPRGLNGHIRFMHPKRKAMTELEKKSLILWQEEVGFLLAHIETEDGLKEALRRFLTDYLKNATPPK